ncbi:MAG: hypothetical protein JXA83_06315 [Acidimicrobiales bacterium]|nr:hypothetical protein [Acidimicrobiales bacterium]
MSRRVIAVAVAAVALVLTAGPVAAQTYPPPQNSITVDDSTPARGQALTITLRTCRPGTYALLGIDRLLAATPKVDAQGVATATVTVPRWLSIGVHRVSGACLAAAGPLFLSTDIRVVDAAAAGSGVPGGASGGGGTGASGNGSGTAPEAGTATDGTATGGSGTATATGDGGGTASGGHAAAPSLGGLAGATVPDDAPTLFEEAAAANGVTEDGGSASPEATAERTAPGGAGDSGPGTMSAIARVALGVAALGGVPVALAVSRRPQRVVRRSFA